MSFVAELKRRNVLRMAGLYLVGAWLAAQVAGTLLPMFGAPVWVPRSIVVLLAVAFIPALVFAWVYEITPEGIKREQDLDHRSALAQRTNRLLDRVGDLRSRVRRHLCDPGRDRDRGGETP